jgi:predicted ester cyclase
MSMMSELEKNRTALLWLIEEGFNKGDLSVADEIVAADSKEHQRGNSDGSAGAKEVIETLHAWFPDFKMSVEDIVAVGDKVWAHFTARGTNLGPVMGRPPTGKKVAIDVIDIVRFKDGKVVEHWGVPDQLGLMIQLGLMR